MRPKINRKVQHRRCPGEKKLRRVGGSKLKAQRRDSPQGDAKNLKRKVYMAGSMGQREAEAGKRGS
jgi:hypothetical protein